MRCKNCGNKYKLFELKCPHCDETNLLGKMWQVDISDEELEYLSENNSNHFNAYTINRYLSRICLLIIPFLVLMGIGMAIMRFSKFGPTSIKTKLNMQEIEEHMNELYEEGKFTELDYFMDQNGLDIYDYDEYADAYMMSRYYNNYLDYKYEFMEMNSAEKALDDYALLYSLTYSSRLYCFDYDLSAKDQAILDKYREEIESYWYSLNMSEEDKEVLRSSDFILSSEAEEIAERVKVIGGWTYEFE